MRFYQLILEIKMKKIKYEQLMNGIKVEKPIQWVAKEIAPGKCCLSLHLYDGDMNLMKVFTLDEENDKFLIDKKDVKPLLRQEIKFL